MFEKQEKSIWSCIFFNSILTDTSMIPQDGLVQNLIRIQILSLILTEREKKSHPISKYLTDFALLDFFFSHTKSGPE